uniref:Uncharacterized protein n=1 Tax=Arundo donax TaxID=35708 RepID=A0A0A8ZTM8_ARUDO
MLVVLKWMRQILIQKISNRRFNLIQAIFLNSQTGYWQSRFAHLLVIEKERNIYLRSE